MQPFTFGLDGCQHTVALMQWSNVQASDHQQEDILSHIMLSLSPINSYLFDTAGKLLHANNPAAHTIRKTGVNPYKMICCRYIPVYNNIYRRYMNIYIKQHIADKLRQRPATEVSGPLVAFLRLLFGW